MACDDQHTLKREGLTARTRGLDALSPSYSRVDERSIPDLVLFAKRYASFVGYVNTANEADGNWQPLMEQDVSVAWASLMALDGHGINRYQKKLFKNIDLAFRNDNRDEAKKQFKYVFDLLYGLVKTLDSQAAFLSAYGAYGLAIRDILIQQVASPYRKLRHLKKEHPNLFASSSQTDPEAPVDVIDSDTEPGLVFIDGIDEVLPVQIPSTTILNKIHYLAHHNLFMGQVSSLLGGISLATKRAADGFTSSLENYSGHEPHYALFLAFLKLFGHAQDSLNEFGKRHLDFYYREVLRLSHKKAQPDTAFLTFELQKAVAQHALKKGTLFKGGKDSAGAEKHYALLEDLVLNKAKVSLLQAEQLQNGHLLVAKAADSVDGQGAPLATADKSWPAFGNPDMPPTHGAGFALASHLLFMREGSRSVTLSFTFGSPLPAPPSARSGRLVAMPFSIRLTGEKGWWEQDVEAAYVVGSNRFELVVLLGVDDPEIVPYDENVHEAGFDTGLPLLLAYFRQADARVSYQELMEAPLVSVSVRVQVTGMKDLALSNGNGTIDSSKPFKPFGDFPKLGANFIIGSKEIFQKKLAELKVNGPDGPAVSFQYLHGGDWSAVTASGQDTAGRYRLAFTPATAPTPSKPDFTPNNYLNVRSHEGFLRMRLQDGSYSLEKHIEKINNSLQSEESVVIPPPAEITLEALSADYTTQDTVVFPSEGAGHGFYHLHPLGYSPVGEEEQSMLPRFAHAGVLYIGLDGVSVPATVTLLFEIAEGSSHPLKVSGQVEWHYLDNTNQWLGFDESDIRDGTKNFSRSGILTINLPSDTGNAATRLQTGLHWIRASIQADMDTVCRIISVQAQAGTVMLVQDDPVVFREKSLPGAISKFLLTDSAVKKVAQPMASYGGTPEESDERFYTRVSERLRHKQRAVTIWDYEHLVLEQFPEVYKVKCINHAGFYEAGGVQVFCEHLPGHVTIIPTPLLVSNAYGDPLKPYAPLNLLVDIQAFLDKLKDPFVTVHVRNPQFEDIKLRFDVKFHAQLDETFHISQLNMDIERFLCPWAYDSEASFSYGGKVSKSALINFIDERPYVDYISNFKMNHIIRGENGQVLELRADVEEASGSSSRSVLVSHAVQQGEHTARHDIRTIQNNEQA